MKVFWETVAVAFSMFSALPMPSLEWNEKNMRYTLCAFPLIGLVIGAVLWGWSVFCAFLGLPAVLRGAGVCLIPAAVTGGIHLDGFADTSDALASWAGPERRQEILKDSHCGAFAIIRLCMYFVGYFGLCCALPEGREVLLPLGLSFVLSRSLSGFAMAARPLAKNTGLAHTFASAAHKSRVKLILGLLALATAAGMIFTGGLAGGAMVLAALAVLWHYLRTADKLFGGISGDLAGWFLQRAEFWMLAALVLCRYGEELL